MVRQRNLPFDVPLSSGMSVADEAEAMLACVFSGGSKESLGSARLRDILRYDAGRFEDNDLTGG